MAHPIKNNLLLLRQPFNDFLYFALCHVYPSYIRTLVRVCG